MRRRSDVGIRSRALWALAVAVVLVACGSDAGESQLGSDSVASTSAPAVSSTEAPVVPTTEVPPATTAVASTSPPESTAAANTTAPAETEPTPSGSPVPLESDDRGVAVVVRGLATSTGTICPAGQADCVYGIRVEGPLGDTAAGEGVLARGWYDGARLLLAGPVEPWSAPVPFSMDFSSLCPGMTNEPGVDQYGAVERAGELLGTSRGDGSESVAAVWIDREANVFTFWFAHDLERHRDAVLEIFRGVDAEVCLVDGAQFSERELRGAARQVNELVTAGLFLDQGGLATGGRENRVLVPIEALDSDGRTALEQFGDAVVAVPFIELLDHPLDALPTWKSPVDGTVELITAAARAPGGMEALGRFTLEYDAAANCLFWMDNGLRGTMAWPFGYTATEANGIATVYDAGGIEVAVTGQLVELGGGEGGSSLGARYLGDNLCGATEVWEVNS